MPTLNVRKHFNAEWLDFVDSKLLEIEEKLDARIDMSGVEVEYLPHLIKGQLNIDREKDVAVIQLGARLTSKENTFERLIIKAHEFGHLLDLVINYDADSALFIATHVSGAVVVEQDAWEIAFEELREVGYGELGHNAWAYFVEFGTYYLSTYYNALYALTKFEWDKDAASFFRTLVAQEAEVKLNGVV